jgi:hypothetical protein
VRKRLLSILAGFAAAALAASVAAAGNIVFSTQQGNLDPLPCLGAAKRFAGTITVTTVVNQLRGRDDGRGNRKVDAEFKLSFRFDPNDTSLPSNTGSQIVYEHDLISDTEDSIGVSVALSVVGSDGSSASLNGTETLLLSKRNAHNLNISISDNSWSCA